MARSTLGFRYPAGADPNNVPVDLQRLAEDVDSHPGIARLTTAQRDALVEAGPAVALADARWTGKLIYNTTLAKAQVWTGAAWADVGGGAQLGTAQTWTEDQTMEAGNVWLLGTSGVVGTTVAGGTVVRTFNAKYDGANWIRTIATGHASILEQHTSGDLVYYVNSDGGSTVGSVITWTERWRIKKDGEVVLTRGIDGTALRGMIAAAKRFEIGVTGGLQRWATDGSTEWPHLLHGQFDPNGNNVAPPGSVFQRRDGGVGTSFFIKESGAGSNLGWVPLIGGRHARKTTTESVTSSTTMQDDDHLLVPIGANEIWIAEWRLQTDGAAAGDIKIQIDGPAASDGIWYGVGPDAGVSIEEGTGKWAARSLGSSAPYGVSGNRTNIWLACLCRNSVNAGDLKLRWCQNVSDGTATRVFLDSFMIAKRIG